jgi:hypothetical protein
VNVKDLLEDVEGQERERAEQEPVVQGKIEDKAADDSSQASHANEDKNTEDQEEDVPQRTPEAERGQGKRNKQEGIELCYNCSVEQAVLNPSAIIFYLD